MISLIKAAALVFFGVFTVILVMVAVLSIDTGDVASAVLYLMVAAITALATIGALLTLRLN